MQASTAAVGPQSRLTALVLLGAFVLGAGLAVLTPPFQIYLVLLLFTAVAAAWFIPRMSAKEPTLSVRFLTWALVAKLVGSLVRYLVFEVIYRELGDASLYHDSGILYYEMVRGLDFSFMDPPYVGTTFIGYAAGFLYAFTGPTLPGAFLVFAMLAWTGAWFFYRAHRVAFPDGNHRLFALFIFFFPTMVFWPSSLGKDALIVFGLGVATYGLARLVRRVSAPALLHLLAGVAVAFAVRPGIAAVFIFGSCMAFLLHPGRIDSPLTRPVALVVLGPAMLVGTLFVVNVAAVLEGFDPTASGAQEYYVDTAENLETGGSGFENTAAPPTSATGAIQAVATVFLRPLPTEVGSAQEALAALETLTLVGILLWRLPASLRALKRWRGGMIVGMVITTLGLVLALGAFSNAGALARQRAQLLPFVFLVFTAAPKRQRGAVRVDQRSSAELVPAASA